MSPPPELAVLVVEDEPSTRRELVEMLVSREDVRVLGRAGDVESAVELLQDREPDVVFLDIRLRGRSGFQLLPHLPAETSIIFVTAYEEHAVRAFEVDAVDYLLKPVTDARLDRALDRVGGGVAERTADDRDAARLAADEHLFLRLGSSWGFLRVGDIRCVLAEGDYTRVVTRSGEASLVSKTMSEWEERLPASTFLRIHRSTLVNLEDVTEVEDQGDGSCRVHLRGADRSVSMSRRYAARIREQLG